MIIGDQFWSKFLAYAKAFPHYKYNEEENTYKLIQDYEEADIYDVFNLIREKVNGGWTYTSTYLDKIDKEILKEEQNARSYNFI